MANIKYSGLDKLKTWEAEEMKMLVEGYAPKFEHFLPKFNLTVAAKKTKLLGNVGRYNVNLILESPKGKFRVEQSGWGLVKTTRRCGEHMHNLLEHKV